MDNETKASTCTEHQFLVMGLRNANYTTWQRCKASTNAERFRRAFCATPLTVAQIWEDLRSSTDEHIKLNEKVKPMHLLMALRFLAKYQSYQDLGSYFHIQSDTTVQKYVRYYVPRLSHLMKKRLLPLEEIDEGFILMLTIDGVHCPLQEQRPFSTDYSSHKRGGKPAANYELGLCSWTDRIGWIKGPTKPGVMNDFQVFRRELMGALPEGRKVLGDDIYVGAPEYVITKNDLDQYEIAQWKNRLLARHENLNKRFKDFKVLREEFEHGVDNHGYAFYACATVISYGLDNGSVDLLDPTPSMN
jgi:hypothetical protein